MTEVHDLNFWRVARWNAIILSGTTNRNLPFPCEKILSHLRNTDLDSYIKYGLYELTVAA